MSIISPYHISLYSKCPKKTQFAWHDENKDKINQPTVVEDVIKKTYYYYYVKEIIPTWRNIMTWTQNKVASTVDDITTQESYKKVKSYLQVLSDWYDKFFLGNYCYPGFINVPIHIGLGHHLTLQSSMDILAIGNNIKLMEFEKVAYEDSINSAANIGSYSQRKLFNNFEIQIKAWVFSKIITTKQCEYSRILIGANTIKIIDLFFSNESLNNIEKIIKQITRGINDNVFYPSFSEQCLSCPFISKCNI
jgi:hypothetical protein